MKADSILTRSIILCSLPLAFACSDDPKPSNEEELITHVQLTFYKTGGEPIAFTWNDPDGETGSGVPEIEDITLDANTQYSMSVSLGDHSSGTLVDITADIYLEAEDHQFFFIPDSNLDAAIQFTYDDEDENSNPLGLENIVQTADAGAGKLKVILRHKPKKDGSGVSDGDITNAAGDTDIEIEFDVTVTD